MNIKKEDLKKLYMRIIELTNLDSDKSNEVMEALDLIQFDEIYPRTLLHLALYFNNLDLQAFSFITEQISRLNVKKLNNNLIELYASLAKRYNDIYNGFETGNTYKTL